MPSNQQKIVLPCAQYKLAYNILTAVETVLLTNSSLVHCIFVFSQEFEITNFFFFFGGEVYVTPCRFFECPCQNLCSLPSRRSGVPTNGFSGPHLQAWSRPGKVDSSRLEPLKSVSGGATARFSRRNCNWLYAKQGFIYTPQHSTPRENVNTPPPPKSMCMPPMGGGAYSNLHAVYRL